MADRSENLPFGHNYHAADPGTILEAQAAGLVDDVERIDQLAGEAARSDPLILRIINGLDIFREVAASGGTIDFTQAVDSRAKRFSQRVGEIGGDANYQAAIRNDVEDLAIMNDLCFGEQQSLSNIESQGTLLRVIKTAVGHSREVLETILPKREEETDADYRQRLRETIMVAQNETLSLITKN